jgi:hypothetical protein
MAATDFAFDTTKQIREIRVTYRGHRDPRRTIGSYFFFSAAASASACIRSMVG